MRQATCACTTFTVASCNLGRVDKLRKRGVREQSGSRGQPALKQFLCGGLYVYGASCQG